MPNEESGRMNVGIQNEKVLFRKKAVGNYADEARVQAPHRNTDFLGALGSNSRVFNKNNNICCNVYDSAHRFGIDKPFKV